MNASAIQTAGGMDVGTTSTTVLTADPNRKGLHISNPSDTRIWFAWNQPAVVDQGFFLDPGGAATYDEALLPIQALFAIHESTGTKRVATETFS